MLLVWIFFLSLGLIVYTYLGYPVILFILSRFMGKEVRRGPMLPSVAVIIPVHNEEKIIEAKVRNCLAFDYPEDKLKILVVSDGSSDQTDEIVERFDNKLVELLRLPFRGGKVAAQNYAVLLNDADIFVFTDAAISTAPESIRRIVENFNDNSVGAVSCTDEILERSETPQGEKNYIRYDMIVRNITSRMGSLIGVTGGFYAVRREIAKGGWNPAFPPDFYVAIRTIKRGMRVIEDSRVKACYRTAAKEWDELSRKVRTINRGLHAFFAVSNRALLNPFRHGVVSLQLISHKLLRWLTPFLFAVLFISNVFLVPRHHIALVALIPQVALYSVVALAFLFSKRIKRWKVLKLANYFFIANMAIVTAWKEFFFSKKYVMWQPTKR
jgi:cellulose synthase/poly-beta-1,6-N-acetylglucosamine synthase-like glycosyltransferase